MHPRTMPAAAVLLVAAALAGCGGKKAAAVTRKSFAQGANALCNQVNAEAASIPTPGSDTASQVAYLKEQLTLYVNAFKRIEGLPQPAADTAMLRSLFAKVNSASSLLSKEIADEQSGDAQGAFALSSQVSAAGQAANLAMSAYGMVDCEES